MEYLQSRIATLHDLDDPRPAAPTDQAAVVVPMTEHEYAGLAAERVLNTLEDINPAKVIIPLRASKERVGSFYQWLTGYDLSLEILWCDGPHMAELLSEYELDGVRGKGRDVWLALGRAAQEEFVVVHDADTKSYSSSFLLRLLFPLGEGYDFSKAYYARVEDSQLYGRLFRLFYLPLVRVLAEAHPGAYLRYLDAYRYALAGEFAATSRVVKQLRAPRTWGLEIGTLADAFRTAGFESSVQVDLGRYEHDHRAVSGPAGLSDMAESVAATLFRSVEEQSIQIQYDSLRRRYRTAATKLLDQYQLDAGFNAFQYDREAEFAQIETYATAITPGLSDPRMPSWSSTDIDPDEVSEAAKKDASRVV